MWTQSIDCQRIPPQYFYKKKNIKKLCELFVSYVCAVVTNRQKRRNAKHGLENKITKKFLDIKNYSRLRTPSER